MNLVNIFYMYLSVDVLFIYLYVVNNYSRFSRSYYKAGKLKLNVAPSPSSLFSAQICPPCASIILLVI
jgi:hypothetical protein